MNHYTVLVVGMGKRRALHAAAFASPHQTRTQVTNLNFSDTFHP